MGAKHLFISYARRDGQALAFQLQADLIAAGYDVWLDRTNIRGGTNWPVEIETAIEQCDVMLALLSDGSFASKTCRDEQSLALDKNKRVIPILVQRGAKSPLRLVSLNYLDFSETSRYNETIKLLISDLAGANEHPVIPRPTTNAEPLPPVYVERPDLLARLRDALLDDTTDRRVALTALHGIGGIGKSVLASAICHDLVVHDAYPDGVICLRVGQSPANIVEQMRIIGQMLNDDLTRYTSESEAESRLRTLLPGKSVLIVLDDVWDVRFLLPFLIDAPRSRILFTTRDKSIATDHRVRAAVLTVQPMQRDEALDLLQRLTGLNGSLLEEIAHEIGYHPLALTLAGGRIRRGMTPTEWLTAFREKGIALLKERPSANQRHDNIEVCFGLSVDAVISANRPLCYALGIFAEDVWIPCSAVMGLWGQFGLSSDEAGDLLEQIVDLALVEERATDKALSIHDLLLTIRTKSEGVS